VQKSLKEEDVLYVLHEGSAAPCFTDHIYEK